jgi:hypothetical protein
MRSRSASSCLTCTFVVIVHHSRRGRTRSCATLEHIMQCTTGLKIVTNVCNCKSCWRFRCKFTPPLTVNFAHIFKFLTPLKNYLAMLGKSVPPPFSLTSLLFDKLALAIIRLATAFQRISHYTLYINFRSTLKMCVHFFGPPCIII